MANLNIDIVAGIYAVVKEGNIMGLKNTPIVFDPISESYSTYAPLVNYNITIKNTVGLTKPIVLHNGKNSRFSAEGSGSCELHLEVEDELGNKANTMVTITLS